MDCIFCKIVKHEIPAKIIYQDEDMIAFDDINPKAPTHKLIVPRKHISTLNDLTEEDTQLMGKLMQAIQKLAKQLGIAEAGYRTVINCNKGGGQLVYHLHIHLLGGRSMTHDMG